MTLPPREADRIGIGPFERREHKQGFLHGMEQAL
jgi:hypothetical protein